MSEYGELKLDKVNASGPVIACRISTVLLAPTEILPGLQLPVFHPSLQKNLKIM